MRFHSELRAETERLCERLHSLQGLGRTPDARYEKKCRACSLLNVCMPRATGEAQRAGRYLRERIREAARLGAEDDP